MKNKLVEPTDHQQILIYQLSATIREYASLGHTPTPIWMEHMAQHVSRHVDLVGTRELGHLGAILVRVQDILDTKRIKKERAKAKVN